MRRVVPLDLVVLSVFVVLACPNNEDLSHALTILNHSSPDIE